jgi:hypothetical protein
VVFPPETKGKSFGPGCKQHPRQNAFLTYHSHQASLFKFSLLSLLSNLLCFAPILISSLLFSAGDWPQLAQPLTAGECGRRHAVAVAQRGAWHSSGVRALAPARGSGSPTGSATFWRRMSADTWQQRPDGERSPLVSGERDMPARRQSQPSGGRQARRADVRQRRPAQVSTTRRDREATSRRGAWWSGRKRHAEARLVVRGGAQSRRSELFFLSFVICDR